MNKQEKELISTIQNMKSDKDLYEFLRTILSPQELEEISKRLQIIKMLSANTPQRLIAEKLKVGIATITRGSRAMKESKLQNICPI